jgi:hypothetical protein
MTTQLINQPFYFPDDIFGVIKEFTGLYSLSTDWSKVKKLRRCVLLGFIQRYMKIRRFYHPNEYFYRERTISELLVLLHALAKAGKLNKRRWRRLEKLTQKPKNIYDEEKAKEKATTNYPFRKRQPCYYDKRYDTPMH